MSSSKKYSTVLENCSFFLIGKLSQILHFLKVSQVPSILEEYFGKSSGKLSKKKMYHRSHEIFYRTRELLFLSIGKLLQIP